MDLETIKWIAEAYGLPGMVIAFLFWENRRLRQALSDRIESEIKTLREVLPAVQVLSNALDLVKGRGD